MARKNLNPEPIKPIVSRDQTRFDVAVSIDYIRESRRILMKLMAVV
jgi:hypothetical protein